MFNKCFALNRLINMEDGSFAFGSILNNRNQAVYKRAVFQITVILNDIIGVFFLSCTQGDPEYHENGNRRYSD